VDQSDAMPLSGMRTIATTRPLAARSGRRIAIRADHALAPGETGSGKPTTVDIPK
jgi:L-aminopeptidase/D-esterase-like protein